MKWDLFINGQWKEATQYKALYSPFSGDKIADVGYANEVDTEAAIQAAESAAEKMAKLPAHKRSAILDKVAHQIEARKEELAQLLASEAAKPLKTARGEIARTIQTYKFAAMEASRIHGETIPLDAAPGGEGRIAFTIRKPLGVVAAITPFNFPFNLVAHKVGPAIAAGNSVVLKPADQTPISSLVLAEIFQEAGLPDGALNIIPGLGSVVGEMLVCDSRVKAVSFTGSPAVGIAIKNKAGLKRVTLELGSNSGLIIDQTYDISDELIDRCVIGAFSYSGQVCISIQRIYVHEDKYEEFITKFKIKVEKLVIGDPFDETTDISALIHEKEVNRMQMWVDLAVSRGAQVIIGGKAHNSRIFKPTILTNVASDEPVSCEEVFGPIVTVSPFGKLEQAIEEVNHSRFGLQAGIYTNDIHSAMQAAVQLEVGGVMINDFPTFRVDNMPYGGVKESGFGREGVQYAVEEMTEIKLITINLK
ncbi:aldehyde dehydrogenase family protein [Paenibacillus sp. FSL K6-0276]|uniref:aldehyde dehydrogenase family protein n=1 Tax=Paenibacillus sp. FSL K6-0276 TaxID=2921450 RepID=UPI0030EB804B